MATQDSVNSINTFIGQVNRRPGPEHFQFTRIAKKKIKTGTLRLFNFKGHPDKDIVFTTLDDKFVSITRLTDEMAKDWGIKRPGAPKEIKSTSDEIQLTSGL